MIAAKIAVFDSLSPGGLNFAIVLIEQKSPPFAIAGRIEPVPSVPLSQRPTRPVCPATQWDTQSILFKVFKEPSLRHCTIGGTD
jgi:hypothetical protein